MKSKSTEVEIKTVKEESKWKGIGLKTEHEKELHKTRSSDGKFIRYLRIETEMNFLCLGLFRIKTSEDKRMSILDKDQFEAEIKKIIVPKGKR